MTATALRRGACESLGLCGGYAGAGANGYIQGYVQFNQPLFGIDGGLTLGSSADTGNKFGLSLGFYQSVPGKALATSFYWHEVGHSINFFLSGAFGNNRNGLGVGLGTFLYFGFTLPGTGILMSPYNPFSWIGEGTAGLWAWIFSGELHGIPL